MAAQEYYQGSVPQSMPQQPQPPQQRPPTLQAPPYPLYDGPPPPYSAAQDQRPHSQPPPNQRYSSSQPGYQPSGLSQQYRPPSNGYETHQYPPEKVPQQPYPQDGYRPPIQQDYQQRPPPPSRQHYSQPAYANAPAVQPYAPTSQPSFRRDSHSHNRRDTSYDSRDRSRSRSRGRDRDYSSARKLHHQRKKSSGVNTFLGAGGGALIGDAIFPGLGTLGGALLGGFGGHEYGKSKGKTHYERSPTGIGGGRRRRYSDDYDEYRRGRKH